MGLPHALDRNAVIAITNDRPRSASVKYREAVASGELLVVFSIVLYELWYGVARSGSTEDASTSLKLFLSGPIDVVEFSEADAEICGRIRADLTRRGTPIGPYNLLIGAQALRMGATLVTANTDEFARIDGLRLEDWTR
ncbi:MAG TPA: PIN domain-containing protein [Chloroflexota bacterium]|nr:PIN domain-containing protein [Chloroflexota bacterium]